MNFVEFTTIHRKVYEKFIGIDSEENNRSNIKIYEVPNEKLHFTGLFPSDFLLGNTT